ncbi:MAG TPA: pyridoxal phosphate-dependent aminotransferase [Bacteroidota bacterium]|nr:pyridoxal phosphate-dependent aminotransferase [Bacteroidota bacterium]
MERPLSKKISRLEESQTLRLSARARNMRAEGIDVVSLTAGEPDFPTPQPVKDAAIRAINENFTKYTANEGIPELRHVITHKFKNDNDLNFEPSEILVSSGAKHCVFNALQALCDRGDEVIIPAPYYVSYPEIVKLVDATPVFVQTSVKNDFKLTPAQLRKAITRKTKAMILCSPSNPTGAVYTPREIFDLAEVVARTGIYVISDEIYEKIMYDGHQHASIGSFEPVRGQVVTINGVSKVFSMTGWRIGYMGARRDIIEAAEKVQSQTTSNASSVSQKAALAALSLDLKAEVMGMVREFDRRRKFLTGEIGKVTGLQFIQPGGAFYLFMNVKPFFKSRVNSHTLNSSEDIAEFFLNEHNVAMVPGSGFGAPHWMRLSYACSMEDLQKAVRRLHNGFAELADAVR